MFVKILAKTLKCLSATEHFELSQSLTCNQQIEQSQIVRPFQVVRAKKFCRFMCSHEKKTIKFRK